MKINLEILNASFLSNKKEIEDLNTKKLVSTMILRRRLTRASKLVIELMSKVDIDKQRIIYGTSFGELLSTSNIINAILKDDILSPTDFQNSVYNTAVSYASILSKNTNEILTVSSGEETSLKVLKVGAIKALDKDELLLVCCETLNINNIEEVNNCIDFLETAVALKVKVTKETPTMSFENMNNDSYPKAIEHILHLAKNFKKNEKNIIEVEI